MSKKGRSRYERYLKVRARGGGQVIGNVGAGEAADRTEDREQAERSGRKKEGCVVVLAVQ